MSRPVRVEDLPPDYDWQATADRLDAAARRQADAVWRRKLAARRHRKQGSARRSRKHG